MSILDLKGDSVLSQMDTSQGTGKSTAGSLSHDFKVALDLLPHLVLVIQSGIGYCNTALKNYTGVDSQNIHYSDLIKFLHPEDAEHFYNIWATAQKSGKRFEKECRIKKHDGEYFWFLLIAESHKNPHRNNEFNWTISCTNVHDRAVKLRETADLLRANSNMLDVSVDCIKILTPDGRVSHMNKSGCIALLGQEHVRQFGMDWLSLLPPEIREQGKKAIRSAAKGKNTRFAGKSISGEMTFYWDNMLTPVINEEGETTSILCVSRDVTLQRIAENKLKISSDYDDLTGLMNRRAFKATLRHAITQAKKNKTSIGMMFIDLDYFKNINDTLGHPAGDHLLRVLAKRLIKCANENTFVSRLGGDEFAVIVTNMTSTDDLQNIIQLILKQNDAPVTYSGKLINGGMSIGCAVYPKDASDVFGLMKCADTALNDLKDRGRGGYRMYDKKMLAEAELKTKQLETARMIIRENRIEPFYQPKVRLDDRSIIGFEALLRWRDHYDKIHFPGSVVEAFNDYELATKFSEIMHEKIFTDLSSWIKDGLDVVPVSINASPIEFMRDNYAELLIARLNKFNIPAHLVEIEITEHILSERGSEFVIRALEKLKTLGLRISLDDFGTGHSSMTHLRDYPVDCLKIDYAFVSCMNEENSISSIVEGIAKLGPILSLDVIAEGIETDQQLQSLRAVGCEYGQGFLFSRAIAAKYAEEMLISKVA
ncbi:sensor domain-containing protein [Acinetobacter shaoyimingii]|uniref:EAL domain-containing protein n=1 Tax=Acinetobacter shaoyimingii TaxID=2715164 RepID=A0A6G8RVF3_9GAMM|nr:bifunctional diguanylate cyclase/phosphodiesterase [Acinetobacter shaoyimingii]NHB57483.1 EAL domain-containing protein [Acinetobacter shaoyimingii]QIO05922.1 EAL domain-containing protein [Acinetobacter shaoyimingii]